MHKWVVVSCFLLVGTLTNLRAQVQKPLVPAVSLPITIAEGRIYVVAVINDSLRCELLFDTGTRDICLFKDVASALPDRVNVQKRVLDPRDSLNYGFIRKPHIALGGLHFSAEKLYIVQRTRMPQMTGRHFDGIIGTALLDAFVVRIDYENSRLELFDKASFEGWPGVPAVDFTLSDGIPSIAVSCSIHQERLQPLLQLHTGFTDAMAITRRFADKNALFDHYPSYFYFNPIVAPGHRVPARQVTLPSVDFLGISVTNVPVWLSRRKDGLIGTKSADGILGAAILSSFNVTIDYGRRKLYLEPLPALNNPIILSWHGMRLVMSADFSQCLVDDVLPGSPAEQAGIQVGDELLAVYSEALAFQSMEDIQALISGSERLIELHYRHEKLIFRKVFRIAPVLAPGPQH